MTKEEKTAKNSHKAGHIYQVLGAVVDVKFESEADLPDIYTALDEIKTNKKQLEALAQVMNSVKDYLFVNLMPSLQGTSDFFMLTVLKPIV